MPETVPDHIPSPRAPIGWDDTRWRGFRVHTDGTVQVRGEDQLHSFGVVEASTRSANPHAANGYMESQPVPAGEIWHITNIYVVDRTTATTAHRVYLVHNAGTFHIYQRVQAFGVDEGSDAQGDWWLDQNDVIRAYFIGALITDDCRIDLAGHSFTVET